MLHRPIQIMRLRKDRAGEGVRSCEPDDFNPTATTPRQRPRLSLSQAESVQLGGWVKSSG